MAVADAAFQRQVSSRPLPVAASPRRKIKLGLAAKEKPAGLRRRAFNQFSRGVSYEVRDW